MKKQCLATFLFLTPLINYGQEEKYVKTDSLLVPSFEIEIILSEKAKERILNSKESIIVNVDLEGEPKDTIKENLDETTHRILLLNIEKEVYSPGIVKFENIYVPKRIYDRLKDKNFLVTVQLWTGRHSSEFNLIFGLPVGGMIDEIKNIRHKLKAVLITEM